MTLAVKVALNPNTTNQPNQVAHAVVVDYLYFPRTFSKSSTENVFEDLMC